MKAKVTIGLCIKNCAKIVKTAFDSISIQDFPHELMKLVIVDNGSCDNTLSLALDFAQKTDIPTFVTSSKGKGLAATRQIVVDTAEGDYVVWEDDDLVLAKDYVKKQIEFMEKNPSVGAARGHYDVSSDQGIFSVLNLISLIPSPSLDQIGTGGAIFRLTALEKVRGFDNRIKGAGEDIDVSRRIAKSGWKLATVDSAKLYHKNPKETLTAFWRSQFGYGYGNHYIFHKHGDKQFIIQYFPPFTFLIGLKTSSILYRVTDLKKAFSYFVLYFLTKIAGSLGFARAHLDGYGHHNKVI